MTPPVYGSRAALKLRLAIPADDDTADALLDSALSASSRGIEKSTGRRFWLDPTPVQRLYRTAGRIVRKADGDLLLVDDIGDVGGLVVETGSGTSWSAITGYETQPDNAIADGRPVTGLLRTSGSWATARVRVTTRFGWPAEPEDVTEAALIQATRLYKRKDSPEGIIGSAEWGVRNLSRRDPDVWALIEPYILPGFG
ncbi:phage gp6-like head-tail connector protein [Streptomyces acidiscabies]|uniref:Phage gp6-like head-tail connector protein n=1 Tax=Streptomyces acidiscabies TaxID=42234 RepID=A0ABU4MBJ8_9ACTN|nr:phage gp6-like head-tail connector protein [Streptomyces acidiscabies]MDX3024068.1 phage gp6-like head-tail connector protein [Streptomyces acidiscabies]